MGTDNNGMRIKYRWFKKRLLNRRVQIGYTLERPEAPIGIIYKNLIHNEDGKLVIDTLGFALSEEAAIATFEMLGAAISKYLIEKEKLNGSPDNV